MKAKLKKRILILGITGGFGTGKTTVTGMFKKLGACVIDADRIYHHLLKPKSPTYKRLVSVFGPEILAKNKRIDRKKIAKLVFSKRQILENLTEVTHPQIIKEIRNQLARLKSTKKSLIIVIDAPLLVEAGLSDMVDKLLVVKTTKKVQFFRCQKRWGIGRTEIIKRIKAQLPLTKKIKLADFVIDNNRTRHNTEEQVRNIWQEIKLYL